MIRATMETGGKESQYAKGLQTTIGRGVEGGSVAAAAAAASSFELTRIGQPIAIRSTSQHPQMQNREANLRRLACEYDAPTTGAWPRTLGDS